MIYQAIDSMYVAVADLDAAVQPYERLGLLVSGVENGRRTLRVGGRDNGVAVHFMGNAEMDRPLDEPGRRALGAGRPLFALGLRADDMALALEALSSQPISIETFHYRDSVLAWVPVHDLAGTDLVLVQHQQSEVVQLAKAQGAGLLEHSRPLKRLDHLAIVAHDLEAKTRFWTDVLGVPVAGEVTTPTLIIRQLRIGDTVLELLGAASPDSPLVMRPPGLVSMASWEVADLDEEFRQAKAAGFTGTEPAVGPLPRTRIATLTGTELAGVNMQLLQYV